MIFEIFCRPLLDFQLLILLKSSKGVRKILTNKIESDCEDEVLPNVLN